MPQCSISNSGGIHIEFNLKKGVAIECRNSTMNFNLGVRKIIIRLSSMF